MQTLAYLTENVILLHIDSNMSSGLPRGLQYSNEYKKKCPPFRVGTFPFASLLTTKRQMKSTNYLYPSARRTFP